MTAWLMAAAMLARTTSLPGVDAPPESLPHSGPASLLVSQVLEQPSANQGPGRQDRVDIGGQLMLSADAFPRRDVAELRAQAALEVSARLGDRVRVRFDGFAEALAADRGGRVTDAVGRVREAWVEAEGRRGDIRVGYGRLVWGRLDEVQPSDVINPLDTARYLFDGRSAARLPVGFMRARWFASERLAVEGVLVPAFRRGTFDELDERSSPFNLLGDLVLPATAAIASLQVERIAPEFGWSNVSGGGRVSATIGRVDVATAVFRGFEGFGLVAFEPQPGPGSVPAVVGRLVERFPRFTMVSGDFETVVGEWALRGEAAVFVEKKFLSASAGGVVNGRAIDAGAGFDRRTGEFRVFGSVVMHREWSGVDPAIARTDVSLVGSIERQFGRDRYLARVFGVVNPGDASGFVRALVIWRARDNVSVEGSAAAFLGAGDDTLSRFRTRDFLLTRLRWLF